MHINRVYKVTLEYLLYLNRIGALRGRRKQRPYKLHIVGALLVTPAINQGQHVVVRLTHDYAGI